MRPVAQIIYTLIFSVLICQLAYMTLNKGLEKYNIHKTERLTELFFHHSKYDILFAGSSRTHTGIYPKIIDSICKLSSYNAGVEGGNLFEFNMTVEAYLEAHPPPKYLVLTIDLNSFDIRKRFFNYSQYFPYVENKIIYKALNENGHPTGFLKIFPFLVLTDYDDYTKSNALKGLKGETEIPRGDFAYKGYLSNSENSIKEISVPEKLKNYEISPDGIQYLDHIIKLCYEHDTKLVFTYAPEFNHSLQNQILNSKEILTLIKNKADQNNIPFLRDDNLSICSDAKLFANPGHLNKKGAVVYSAILADELNNVVIH
jgi:hypothetical protein